MIIQLDAENFKRLRAVQIRPDGSLVQITGKNGAGKSSCLDAIQAALGGRSAEPTDPVRHGADSARVAVLTDKYLVEKVFEGGKSRLKVTSPDGRMRFSSPQSLLDELYADIGFDPLAFIRMKPADQAETLRKVAGLDFSELDQRRDGIYHRRRDLNRDAKQVESQLAAIPEVGHGVPDVEVDVGQLTRELNDAMKSRNAIEAQQRHVEELEDNARRLREQLAAVEKTLAAAQEQLASMGTAPDTEPLETMISSAEDTNKLVRQKVGRAKLAGQLKQLQSESASYSEQIAKIDADRKLMIEMAEMPIEGLGFDDSGGITYNAVAFMQASQSEQLRVATAIGMEINPGRLILIREGSLLDTEHLAVLAELVEARGGCVWLERVTDGEAVGVVIEDGAVQGAEASEQQLTEEARA